MLGDVSVIIEIDCNKSIQNIDDLRIIIESIIVSTNAFLLSNVVNRVMLFIYDPNIGFKFINSDLLQLNDPTTFYKRNECLVEEVKEFIKKNHNNNLLSNKYNLTNAIGLVLCHINKLTNCQSKRVVIIKTTDNQDLKYTHMIKSIFTCQRMNCQIFSLALKHTSSYLQQASFLTNGIYYEINDYSQFFYYLFSSINGKSTIDEKNSYLNLPTSAITDLRPSCYCHSHKKEIAFVCTVCLTIVCNIQAKCPQCQSILKPYFQKRLIE